MPYIEILYQCLQQQFVPVGVHRLPVSYTHLLSRIKKGRTVLQTLYYIPVVISSVAICQIFTKLFSVTPTGIINQVLSFFDPSLKFMEWISNPQISLYVTAFVEAYKYLGLYMVIFYAALIGVPDEDVYKRQFCM